MSLPKHTPYRNGDGGVKVGLEPIEEEDWLEIDNLFNSEIELKKKLYESNYKEIHQELDLSLKSQHELLEMLKTHLNQFHPSHKITRTESSTPLKNASLLVQEDLVLMLPAEEKYFLGAASLCAPSNWSLKEKFNGSLIELHKDVPSYEKKIGNRVNNLFDKLPNDRIFQRFNWSIYEEATLFQPIRNKSHVERSKTITDKNAGDRLFIRVERQTIRRLPKTKAIAFTIRVHVDPLSSIKEDLSLVRDLKKAIKNLSEGMKRYKSLGPIETALVGWLDKKIKSLS